MNLQTLDCVIIDHPFENTYYVNMDSSKAEARRAKYLTNLGRVFEFYERAVQLGDIRSYGLSATSSMLDDPQLAIKAIKEHGISFRNEKGILDFEYVEKDTEIRWDV